MYSVRYDAGKNRLFLKIDGYLPGEEAVKFREEIEATLPQTKPGFTLLVDLSTSKALPPESTVEINKARSAGVGYGIRKGALITNSALVKMQAERTMKHAEKSFEELSFTTVEEAEAFLDVV